MNTKTVPSKDDAAGMEWWNNATHQERRYWLDVAKSARPVDAWRAYSASLSERYRYSEDEENGL